MNFPDRGDTAEESGETGDTGVLHAGPHSDLLLPRVVWAGVELPAAVPCHHSRHGSLAKLVVSQVRLGLRELQLVTSVVSLAVQDQSPLANTLQS